jgi:large subunit ribosomal protein L11e
MLFSMDLYIVLERPGFRVSKKKRGRGRIGINHKITKADAQAWFKHKWGGHIDTEQ